MTETNEPIYDEIPDDFSTEPKAPKKEKNNNDRAPTLLLILVALFVVGSFLGIWGAVTFAYSMPLWFSLLLGIVVSVIFPLFMAIRLRQALVRKGLRKSFRRPIILSLSTLIQATWIMVVLFWGHREVSDFAEVAQIHIKQNIGEIPVLGKMLSKLSVDSKVDKKQIFALYGKDIPTNENSETSDSDKFVKTEQQIVEVIEEKLDSGALDRDAGALSDPSVEENTQQVESKKNLDEVEATAKVEIVLDEKKEAAIEANPAIEKVNVDTAKLELEADSKKVLETK